MHTPIHRPGPGQESVWDYPRPPLVQHSDRHVEVFLGGVKVADTTRAVRVIETSHPPVYYVPIEHILPDTLKPSGRATYSEFKGEASYYDVTVGEHTAEHAAWTYAQPAPGYEALTGYVAFYPRLMDECRIDGERVRPQAGQHYGGWITSEIVGPFRGDPGSA